MKVVFNFEAQQSFRDACPRFPPWFALPRPEREIDGNIWISSSGTKIPLLLLSYLIRKKMKGKRKAVKKASKMKKI
jgi:hypothetical protein